MAMGVMGPSVSRGLEAGFHCSLGTHTDSISLTSQGPPLSICSPKRRLSEGDAARIHHSPCAELTEAQSLGLVEFQGYKPAVTGRRAVTMSFHLPC